MPTINSSFYIRSSDSPIFNASYEAVKNIIQRITNIKDLEVVSTIHTDVSREYGRGTLDTKKYPYVVVIPSSINDNYQSYNGFALKKYGTQPIRNGEYYYNFHLRPAEVIFSILFYSQSLEDSIKFMTNWHSNVREGTLVLKSEEGQAVTIYIRLEPNVNFPTRDFQDGNPLKVEANITMYTYTGDVYKIPVLKMTEARQEIVSSFSIDLNDIKIDPEVH